MPYKDKEKQAEYQAAWMQKRRQAWLLEHGPCAHCGSWEDLEVDHIDRTKKLSHRVWSWSKERRDAELAKCQVLCRTCHMEKGREVGDIPPEVTHGNRKMYEDKGCRCEICRKAHTEFQSAWRRSKMMGV